MKSTYSLDIITDTLCKDDEQVDIIRSVIKSTLSIYQWEYQNSTNRAKRDMIDELNDALRVVKEHLTFLGQYTLIDELEKTFTGSDAGLRDSNVLTLAQKYMKQQLLDSGMKEWKYNNEYATLMKEAFIEWCDKYPLREAPAHFDDSFEPTI